MTPPDEYLEKAQELASLEASCGHKDCIKNRISKFAQALQDVAHEAKRELIASTEIANMEFCLKQRSSGCRCTPARRCLSCRCKEVLVGFTKFKEEIGK